MGVAAFAPQNVSLSLSLKEMTQEVVSSAVDKVKSTVTGKKGDSNTQKPSGEEQRDTHQHQKDE